MKFTLITFIGFMLINSCDKLKLNQKIKPNSTSFKVQDLNENFELIVLENKTTNGVNYSKCRLKNKTEQKVYFPVILNNPTFLSDCLPEVRNNFNIEVLDSTNKQQKAECLHKRYKEELEKSYWDTISILRKKDSLLNEKYNKERSMLLLNYKSELMLHQGFVVKPNDSIEFTIKRAWFNDFFAEILGPDVSSFNKKNLLKKNMRILLKVDSATIKKDYLSKSFWDSLNKSNIKIFNGTLSSHQVPINFEE